MTTLSVQDAIRDILGRSNDVREWPTDEQELHRGWVGDFTSRTAAVLALRTTKILDLTARASDEARADRDAQLAREAAHFIADDIGHNSTAVRAIIARLPHVSSFGRQLFEACVRADYLNAGDLAIAYPKVGEVFRAWRSGGPDAVFAWIDAQG